MVWICVGSCTIQRNISQPRPQGKELKIKDCGISEKYLAICKKNWKKKNIFQHFCLFFGQTKTQERKKHFWRKFWDREEGGEATRIT